ncbi:lipase, partial [Streptomyces sp. SID11233]|nr:lipase [Streptomyces sp. SID11233]
MRFPRVTAIVSSLLLAAGATLASAATSHAAAPTGYVALGDSYSSGVGSG